MGFWSKLAGIGAAVGGVVGTAMTGNPTFATTGLKVGGSILSGDAQKGAVDKANAQQQAATNQAQGSLTNVYNTTRADLNPYMTLGAGAAGQMGQMVGLPLVANPTAQAATSGVPGQSLAGVVGHQASPDAVSVGQAVSRSAAQSQNQSGYVRMRAPSGQMSEVPADQVAHFQQRGAEVIQ